MICDCDMLVMSLCRFSRLWMPCVETLAAALEHSTQQAWPLLLDQLTSAQASFLSGRHAPAVVTEAYSQAPQGLSELPCVDAELSRAMQSGEAEQTGGCTDAAVRLTHVLKVCRNRTIQHSQSGGPARLPHITNLCHLHGVDTDRLTNSKLRECMTGYRAACNSCL